MLDLMAGEEDPTRLVFPRAAPVREIPGFGASAAAAASTGRRRRRRRSEPKPPADWDEVFEVQEPVVIRRDHALARWPALTPAALVAAMADDLRAHVSEAPTVQMMSRVQPWGTLSGVHWDRPWTERNVTAAELFVDEANATAEHLYYFTPVAKLPQALRRALGGPPHGCRQPFVG